jgi:hypothetical protein
MGPHQHLQYGPLDGLRLANRIVSSGHLSEGIGTGIIWYWTFCYAGATQNPSEPGLRYVKKQ